MLCFYIQSLSQQPILNNSLSGIRITCLLQSPYWPILYNHPAQLRTLSSIKVHYITSLTVPSSQPVCHLPRHESMARIPRLNIRSLYPKTFVKAFVCRAITSRYYPLQHDDHCNPTGQPTAPQTNVVIFLFSRTFSHKKSIVTNEVSICYNAIKDWQRNDQMYPYNNGFTSAKIRSKMASGADISPLASVHSMTRKRGSCVVCSK